MKIETGTAQHIIKLDTEENIQVNSPGSQQMCYPPIVSISIGHHVFPNGTIGTTVNFQGKAFRVEGMDSLIVIPETAVLGDVFVDDECTFVAVNALTVASNAKWSGLSSLEEEIMDDQTD